MAPIELQLCSAGTYLVINKVNVSSPSQHLHRQYNEAMPPIKCFTIPAVPPDSGQMQLATAVDVKAAVCCLPAEALH